MRPYGLCYVARRRQLVQPNGRGRRPRRPVLLSVKQSSARRECFSDRPGVRSLLMPSPSCFAIHLSQSERLKGRRGSVAKPRVLNESPVDSQTPRRPSPQRRPPSPTGKIKAPALYICYSLLFDFLNNPSPLSRSSLYTGEAFLYFRDVVAPSPTDDTIPLSCFAIHLPFTQGSFI